MAKAMQSPSQLLGEQVRRTRVRKGWTSQQRLSDRLRTLGLPTLDRSAVGRIETGHRGVQLDEALAIAVALEVTPLSLIFPTEDQARVAVAPKLAVSAGEARAWVRGERPLPGHDQTFYDRELPDTWIDARAQAVVAHANALAEAWSEEDADAVEATLDALAAEVKRQRVELTRLRRGA